MPPYQPIDCGFHDRLEAAITQRTYTRLRYLTEWRELLTVSTMLKDLFSERTAEGLAEYLLLGTGERVRLDRIVQLDDTFAPPFRAHYDFSCDC